MQNHQKNMVQDIQLHIDQLFNQQKLNSVDRYLSRFSNQHLKHINQLDKLSRKYDQLYKHNNQDLKDIMRHIFVYYYLCMGLKDHMSLYIFLLQDRQINPGRQGIQIHIFEKLDQRIFFMNYYLCKARYIFVLLYLHIIMVWMGIFLHMKLLYHIQNIKVKKDIQEHNTYLKYLTKYWLDNCYIIHIIEYHYQHTNYQDILSHIYEYQGHQKLIH